MIFNMKHVNSISIKKSIRDNGWIFTIEGFDPAAKEFDTCEYSTIARDKADIQYLVSCLNLDNR